MDLPLSITGATARGVARACASEAGSILRAMPGGAALASVKGRGNVVTEADYRVERAVMDRLAAEFPHHSILSEESATDTRSDSWMWVIDPLDGTKNFSRGIPHFAFTMALCYDSQPVYGLTLHPLLDELYEATAGEGCTLNGARVHVSDCQSVREGVAAFDLGYDNARAARQLELARFLWPGMQGLRVAGSAGLEFAFLAAGRWDIYLHPDLQPWDSAAGILLVREAGGVVMGRDGAPATIFTRALVAAPAAVYADFMKLAGHLPWD
jgi:fructose-1,6-bisphosphatase/inositol monophosphatase family enzyme